MKIPALYNLAGVAAYNSNEFELARAHLLRAHELNALDDGGRKCASALAYSTEAWAEERKQYGRLRRAGLSHETTISLLPRCQKCTTVYLRDRRSMSAAVISVISEVSDLYMHPYAYTLCDSQITDFTDSSLHGKTTDFTDHTDRGPIR